MTALSVHAEEYLRLRRALGHDLASAHRLLPRFVAYLDTVGADTVTVEAALNAVTVSPAANPGTWVVASRDDRGPGLRPPHGRNRRPHRDPARRPRDLP